MKLDVTINIKKEWTFPCFARSQMNPEHIVWFYSKGQTGHGGYAHGIIVSTDLYMGNNPRGICENYEKFFEMIPNSENWSVTLDINGIKLNRPTVEKKISIPERTYPYIGQRANTDKHIKVLFLTDKKIVGNIILINSYDASADNTVFERSDVMHELKDWKPISDSYTITNSKNKKYPKLYKDSNMAGKPAVLLNTAKDVWFYVAQCHDNSWSISHSVGRSDADTKTDHLHPELPESSSITIKCEV